MTATKMLISPTASEVKTGQTPRPETIHVQSPLMKGRQPRLGILLMSDWSVDYQEKRVRFSSGYLVTQSERIPVPVTYVPDRHLRAVRQVAAAIFDVERFYGLDLYDSPRDDTVYLVTWKNPRVSPLDVNEHTLFISERDAILWCQLNPESGATPDDIRPMRVERVRRELFPNRSGHETTILAQQSSAALSAELFRLLLQATTGLGAVGRLRTLLERGVSADTLGDVWKRFKQQDFPERLRQVLRAGT